MDRDRRFREWNDSRNHCRHQHPQRAAGTKASMVPSLRSLPRRLRATSEYVKENVNVAEQYKDWFTGSETSDVAAIKPGEGAVIGRGRGKMAVYRDERVTFTVYPRSAPISTALFAGMTPNDPGIVRATDRASTPTARSSNGPAIVGLSPVSPERKKE